MFTLSDTLSVVGLIFTADHYCTTTCTHSLHIYYLSQLFTSSRHKHMQCIYIPGTCIPSNTTLIIQLLITILILTSRHPIYINIHINYINQYIISISTNQLQKTARKPKAKVSRSLTKYCYNAVGLCNLLTATVQVRAMLRQKM